MQTPHSQDITNVRAASVSAIELPPSKRRKLRRRSELFEKGLVAKVTQEIAVVREALGRIQDDLDRHSTNLLAICEVFRSVET
jgi:hypothetical protein